MKSKVSVLLLTILLFVGCDVYNKLFFFNGDVAVTVFKNAQGNDRITYNFNAPGKYSIVYSFKHGRACGSPLPPDFTIEIAVPLEKVFTGPSFCRTYTITIKRNDISEKRDVDLN